MKWKTVNAGAATATSFAVVAALAMAPSGARALAFSATRPAQAGAVAASQMPVRAENITAGSFGVPQTYPSSGGGDTWFNTWADDGNIYATSDDTSAFDKECSSNFAVNELTGNDPSQLTSPYANCMTSYGKPGSQGSYNDGATWKTDGVISVDGTLYVAVARQVDGYGGYPVGYQASTDASIIKSTDHGRTWSNGFGTTNDPNGAAPPPSPSGKGAEAMFPGSSFGTPVFINYGQDDNPASTADGGDRYVYAMSNDGWAYDGNYEMLGRVLRSKIGDLNAADWQFYTGPPGGNGMSSANWSSDVSKATHIITAPHELDQGGVQYLSGLHKYIFTTGYYPFNSQWPHNGQASQSTWTIYQAPHPWGPWTRFFSEPTTECYIGCSPATASTLGLYDPVPVSKFVNMGGLSDVIFGSGDYTGSARQDQTLYQLHAFPLTLTTNSQQVVDDFQMPCTYSGTWQIQNYAEGGYYGDTAHGSTYAGSSATCTFNGRSIAWVGAKNNNHGYASVSIDGGPATTVDGYAPQFDKQQVIFSKDGLRLGKHTITITVTAQHDAASAGTWQDIDAFIVGH
jgi:hypothetical protein